LVPLLTVGEVLLVGANDLLHSTHVGAVDKSNSVREVVSMSTHLDICPIMLAFPGHQKFLGRKTDSYFCLGGREWVWKVFGPVYLDSPWSP
jgi:hypothetical protein